MARNKEELQILLRKYDNLVKEWNTISLSIAIYFSFSILGLALSLIFSNITATLVMLVALVSFAGFEFKTRREYVRAKEELEEEIYKSLDIKTKKFREIIKRGFTW